MNAIIIRAILAITPFALAAAAYGGWQVRDYRAGEQIARMELAMSDIRTQVIEQNQAAEQAARELERANQDRADAIAAAAEATARARQARGKTVTQEVIRYVQSPMATDCRIDHEWVRISDTAASSHILSENAIASAEPDDRPGTVAAADALSVVAENYLACTDTSDRLIGLQDWVRSVAR